MAPPTCRRFYLAKCDVVVHHVGTHTVTDEPILNARLEPTLLVEYVGESLLEKPVTGSASVPALLWEEVTSSKVESILELLRLSSKYATHLEEVHLGNCWPAPPDFVAFGVEAGLVSYSSGGGEEDKPETAWDVCDLTQVARQLKLQRVTDEWLAELAPAA